MRRLLVSLQVRYAQIAAEMQRLGFHLLREIPLVFPARPEPAIAEWSSDSQRVVCRFRYFPDPPRRVLDWEIPVPPELSLELTTTDEILRDLHGDQVDAAHYAAFLIADSLQPDAAIQLHRCLSESADAFVQLGCVKALERVGAEASSRVLAEFARDISQPGEVRALAAEVSRVIANSRRRI